MQSMQYAHYLPLVAFALFAKPSLAISPAEIEKAVVSQKVPLMCARLFDAMAISMELTENQKGRLQMMEEQLVRRAAQNVNARLGKVTDATKKVAVNRMWEFGKSEYREVMDSVNGVKDPAARNQQLGQLVEVCTMAAEKVMAE